MEDNYFESSPGKNQKGGEPHMDKRGNISSRNMRLFAAIMTLIEALVLTSLAGCADKKVDYGTDTEKLTKSAVCNVKDFSTDETYSDEFSVQIGRAHV